MNPQPALKVVAERAAGQVFEIVYDAALDAAQKATRSALVELAGADPGDINLEDRVTRTEAARRLETTSQTIIRLEEKGAIHADRSQPGRVYVRLSEVEAALRRR